MDYQQATRYLISLGNEIRATAAEGVAAAKLGLENITVLLDDLGRPQTSYPSVLIAGTNGKGSVAAMMEAILRAAGLRTGLYTSPHLIEINERIQVEGAPAPPEDFAALFTFLHRRIESLLACGRLRFHPTFFECLTALGMAYFRQRDVAFAVLEVGMGGRLDATNTACPCVSVITQVDFDHERFLGTTIEAIAGEKAGIIKPGGVVVSTASHPAAAEVIRREARARGARLVEAWKEYSVADVRGEDGRYAFRASHSDGFSLPAQLSLRGRHQIENALAAIAAARELERMAFPVSARSIQQGLASAVWPGRLELVRERPAVFLDGAHNPAGARALAQFWEEHFAGRRVFLIYGAMRDKAVPEITEILFPRATAVILTQPQQSRATAPETLRDISHDLNPNLLIEPRPAEALERALELAAAEDVILATGSLFLVGDLRRTLRTARAIPSAAPSCPGAPLP
ncbi:MAG TPA: folylpolyglutamate synthase/dihydrofolate synthase family protein [Terriglobia bacterium]|nr:folylpolyglutamate synthase/dihydrofolate synthase family protein [Terriglobia bacterium]